MLLDFVLKEQVRTFSCPTRERNAAFSQLSTLVVSFRVAVHKYTNQQRVHLLPDPGETALAWPGDIQGLPVQGAKPPCNLRECLPVCWIAVEKRPAVSNRTTNSPFRSGIVSAARP